MPITELLHAKVRLSAEPLRIGILHYHLRGGGVKTSIENACLALARYGRSRETIIDLFYSPKGSGPAVEGLVDVVVQATPPRRRVSIRPIPLAELEYSDRRYPTWDKYLDVARCIMRQLRESIVLDKCSHRNPYILHAHNLTLGKNPTLSLTVRLLAEEALLNDKPFVVVSHIHDYAEQNRPDRLDLWREVAGAHNADFSVPVAFPHLPNWCYATLTTADLAPLRVLGLDGERCFVLPNSIDTERFAGPTLPGLSSRRLEEMGLDVIDYGRELKGHIASEAARRGLAFDPEAQMLLSPMRIMRRKNSAEGLLVQAACNHRRRGAPYQFAFTLGASDPADQAYQRALEELCRDHALPVAIGFGTRLIDPSNKRQIVEGRVHKYSLSDLLAASAAAVTTSLMEGFGFTFHEGWLGRVPVVGRDLPCITSDFVANGLDLRHTYRRLHVPVRWIPGGMRALVDAYHLLLVKRYSADNLVPPTRKAVDQGILHHKASRRGGTVVVDFGALDWSRQRKVIERVLSRPQAVNKLLELNPGLRRTVRVVEDPPKELIRSNRNVVGAVYGLEAGAKRLEQLYKLAAHRARKPSPQGLSPQSFALAHGKVVSKYLSLAHCHLLLYDFI